MKRELLQKPLVGPGEIYHYCGDLAGPEKYFRQSLTYCSFDSRAHLELGKIHLRQNWWAEPRKELELTPWTDLHHDVA